MTPAARTPSGMRCGPGPVTGFLAGSAMRGSSWTPRARCRDLAERAGLTGISGNLIRLAAELDTAQLRAPYASMIRIRRLSAGDQRRILEQISLLADRDFAGRVQRPFITAM